MAVLTIKERRLYTEAVDIRDWMRKQQLKVGLVCRDDLDNREMFVRLYVPFAHDAGVEERQRQHWKRGNNKLGYVPWQSWQAGSLAWRSLLVDSTNRQFGSKKPYGIP